MAVIRPHDRVGSGAPLVLVHFLQSTRALACLVEPVLPRSLRGPGRALLASQS